METARHLMPRRPRALRSTLPMWARERKDARLEYRLYTRAGPGQAWAVRFDVDASAPRSVVVTELLNARAQMRGLIPPAVSSSRAEDAVQALDDCDPSASPVPDNDEALPQAHEGVVLPSDVAQMTLF